MIGVRGLGWGGGGRKRTHIRTHNWIHSRIHKRTHKELAKELTKELAKESQKNSQKKSHKRKCLLKRFQREIEDWNAQKWKKHWFFNIVEHFCWTSLCQTQQKCNKVKKNVGFSTLLSTFIENPCAKRNKHATNLKNWWFYCVFADECV